MPAYKLPELGYDYGALEPHVSGRIMELHHSKHHALYVKNANETLEKLDDARKQSDFTKLAALERALAFNLSGHVLHSLFWRNLAPGGANAPPPELEVALKRDFGSFDAFRGQMNAVAAGIMGSGWAALVWEPLGARLLVTQIYDHQSNLAQGGIPLMVIDAWEHAYYLQYHNQKATFFEALWKLWNFDDVAARLAAVQPLDVELPGSANPATYGTEKSISTGSRHSTGPAPRSSS
jgi:Fe-Mn family superoxide dismutase